MKKLALLYAMALVLAALWVPQAYGGDVTIPDTVVSGSPGTWYNRTPTPGVNPAGEDQEVEPNCVNTKVWDLEGFALGKTAVPTTPKTLYTIGTWNFTGGEEGWTSGDIFISIGAKPKFGTAADGTGSGNGQIANSFGYNYVLDMNWKKGTFSIYAINSATLLDVYYGQNDESNPYKYVCGGTPVLGAQNLPFTYLTGLSDADVLALYGVYATDGLHNVVGTDLSLIWDGSKDIWFHFTMECGNDNLMGYQLGDPVPIPASALLLGTGLLGLVGLGWRRRETNV